jgi:hypothetical protein
LREATEIKNHIKRFNRNGGITMSNYKSNNNISKFLRFLLTADHNEDWKEIPNTQGRYYISSKGNVLSVCNNEPRILKPYICGGGY